MPSSLPWFGIITSIAKPLGCHGNGSCRYPPMVVTSGNITLMARAAQMVLTCKPSSGAMPAGSENDMLGFATGALAASSSASAGVATDGGPAAGTDGWAAGGGAGT